MCNTVIPGKYCECGKVLETFARYIEECVVVTQDAKKQPGDCGEMNEMPAAADWGCCSECSSAPAATSSPVTRSETKPKIKSESGSSSSFSEETTSESSSSGGPGPQQQKQPANTPPPAAAATGKSGPWTASDEVEDTDTEQPGGNMASVFASARNVPDLLDKLIHAVEDISVALQRIKRQVDHVQRSSGVGGPANSTNQGGGRVIVVETATNIENVVKLFLHRQYTAGSE